MIDVLVVGGIFREIIGFDSEPKQRLGGSGLTAASAAASVGASVALAGAVGSEDVNDVRELLDGLGVDPHLSVTEGRSGTFAHASKESAERPWPLYRPAEGRSNAPPPNLAAASLVLLFGVPDFDPVAEGWVDVAARDAVVLWDRQGWLSRARDDAHVLALEASERIYVANASEAAEDSGADEAWALEHQPPAGYVAALIKRGPKGVLVYRAQAQEPDQIGALSVNATSTIGSGDAFAGAVAARLAAGASLPDAARAGCAVAAALIESGHNLVDEEIMRRAKSLLTAR